MLFCDVSSGGLWWFKSFFKVKEFLRVFGLTPFCFAKLRKNSPELRSSFPSPKSPSRPRRSPRSAPCPKIRFQKSPPEKFGVCEKWFCGGGRKKNMMDQISGVNKISIHPKISYLRALNFDFMFADE